MVSFGATAAGLFWTVNVWAHPVISRADAVASSISTTWCYSRCFFEVRRIVCEEIKQTLNNELKFHIVNIYCVYVRLDESSLYSGLTMSTADEGFSAVSGNN